MKSLKLFIALFTIIFFVNGYSQKGDDIFPVELVYFEAHLTLSGVLLRWGTATEVNNFGFEVQRADATKQFVGLDFVPGSGTSNSPKHYFYFDTTITETGMYYYRLKQIDIDGLYRYSDTVSILYQTSSVNEEKLSSQLNVFLSNNIRTKELIINFEENLKQEISFDVYSITGQKVYEGKINFGQKIYTLNYSRFRSGVFVIIFRPKLGSISAYKFISIH